jgi:ATP-dependent phosphofructokinase / diphosphate-dependent phosphofructokinase
MNRPRRIGVLTGGGDVPGLNPVIKSVVYKSTELGFEVLGIRRGWQGLTHMRPGHELDSENVRRLDRQNTRGIDRTGGTMLHTSRVNPRKMKKSHLPPHHAEHDLKKFQTGEATWDLTPIVLENLQHLGIDELIAIGGDDTLSFAYALNKAGVHVTCIPKTMDNDVRGTEYCIGFSTAITRAKELITRQRTTIGSHERIGVFRIFGRDSGFTALYTAYVTSIRCVIPELPFDLEKLVALLYEDRKNNPSRYSLVIASEGAVWKGRDIAEFGEADAYGHRKKVNIGEALADEIKRITGVETISSDLTYDLRSGEPDALDEMVAITFANVAMDLIRDGIHGRLVAIQDGKYAHTPIPDPKLGAVKVDVDKLYNVERFRPHYSNKLGMPLLLTPSRAAD